MGHGCEGEDVGMLFANCYVAIQGKPAEAHRYCNRWGFKDTVIGGDLRIGYAM